MSQPLHGASSENTLLNLRRKHPAYALTSCLPLNIPPREESLCRSASPTSRFDQCEQEHAVKRFIQVSYPPSPLKSFSISVFFEYSEVILIRMYRSSSSSVRYGIRTCSQSCRENVLRDIDSSWIAKEVTSLNCHRVCPSTVTFIHDVENSSGHRVTSEEYQVWRIIWSTFTLYTRWKWQSMLIWSEQS